MEWIKFYVLVNKIDKHEYPCIFLTREKAEEQIKGMHEEYWDIVERRVEDVPMFEP